MLQDVATRFLIHFVPTVLLVDLRFNHSVLPAFTMCLQVVTAKSSEMNLVLVAADPSVEDVVEQPVPEQFISTFKDGKLVTVAASHGGG